MLLVIKSYIDAIQLYTISKVKSPKKKPRLKKIQMKTGLIHRHKRNNIRLGIYGSR